MISAEVLLRCPRRRLGKRNSLWAPPTQWTMRTISEAASSISATTSWMRVRTMRLLEASIRRRCIPDRFEVRGQHAERSWIGNRRGRRRIMHGDLALDLRRVGERSVPARFQLARHQPVRWVSGIVLPESPVGGIARSFQIATESIAHLITPFPGSLGSSGCSGDSARTDDAKQCVLDCIIDAQSAEGDAVRAAIVHPGAAAAVARDMVLHAGVPECELAAAAFAPDQTGQQRVTMLGRAVMPTGGNVAADHG